MPVYKILEEIMQEKGISIADIAKTCNLPDSTVRGIVRRKQETIALEVAFKLSTGLDVSLERLNGMPEKENSSPDTTDTVTEEELNELFDFMQKGLVSLGLIRSGQDITERQADILIGVCKILRATFEN